MNIDMLLPLSPRENTIEYIMPPEIDNSFQATRRKMLRRAANRKSAQLSRARKKAHMEDLKAENARLQKVVDILESQPELLFCITLDGRFTYIPERTLNFFRIALPNCFQDEDPVQISQILSSDSVKIILQTIIQLNESDPADHEIINSFGAKEVYFHENCKCKFVGYLRCSKVIRAPESSDDSSNHNSNIDGSESDHKLKKSKKTKINNGDENIIVPPSDDQVVSIANAVAALSSLCQNKPIDPKSLIVMPEDTSKPLRRKLSTSGHSEVNESEVSYSVDVTDTMSESCEAEFVCVIRSADVSLPKDNNWATSLSRASVEAHNMGQRLPTRPVPKYTITSDSNRPSSPNSSLSSSLKSLNSFNNNTSSDSYNGAKNSTSSEASSEDNNVPEDSGQA